MDSTIEKVLNNRKHLKAYKKILSKLATYIKSLKGPEGELIPVIFRPYHEHTGSWFWWGGDDYVDILGFDTYHRNAPFSDSVFIANTKRMVATIKKLGTEKNKLYAITETGLERVTENDWWTRIV